MSQHETTLLIRARSFPNMDRSRHPDSRGYSHILGGLQENANCRCNEVQRALWFLVENSCLLSPKPLRLAVNTLSFGAARQFSKSTGTTPPISVQASWPRVFNARRHVSTR